MDGTASLIRLYVVFNGNKFIRRGNVFAVSQKEIVRTILEIVRTPDGIPRR